MRTLKLAVFILTCCCPALAWPHVQQDTASGNEFGELLLIGLLALAGAWYALGYWRLWSASHAGRGTLLRHGVMFASGWLTIAASLLSPLHELGGRSFTAHMIEHELLMLLAAPLMALSQPIGMLMWAFPRTIRHALANAGRNRWYDAVWTRLSSPLNASLLQAAMLWMWHAPAFFNRALQGEGWHALQHLSLVFSALLFWWSLNRASALERKHGATAAFLFFTSIHSGLLGALMTFAESPWYWRYAAMGMSGTAGLSALEDQQLAGLIMWIPGGAIHAVVALIYLRRWFNFPPNAVAHGLCVCVIGALLSASGHAQARELRVCADPNNLPFSNEHEAGFENRIVEVVARELDAKVVYVWWAQRRGNIRNTLNAGLCDLIPGVASGLEMLATTEPYYRSAYVFVTRAKPPLDIRSFDDERLRKLTIGVQMIGDDFSNTPPAHALSRRGMVENVRGFMLYGDYAQDSPPRAIIDAVASGAIDVAVVWGPLAGYYARKQKIPLSLNVVSPLRDGAVLPMAFDISMGVRKQDAELLHAVDAALRKCRVEIAEILREYSVPVTGAG